MQSKPIEILICGQIQKSAPEICAALLETERWSEFTGYFILPGVKSADFEVKTPEIVGSRIKVQNTDGSTHLEEIIEWEPNRQVAMKFQNFEGPVKNLATHFVETWSFEPAKEGVTATRKMAFFPKNWLGWLVLIPISQLMKKAFEKELKRQGGQPD